MIAIQTEKNLRLVCEEARQLLWLMDYQGCVETLTRLKRINSESLIEAEIDFETWCWCVSEMCSELVEYSRTVPENVKKKNFERVEDCATMLDEYFPEVLQDSDCDYAITCLIGIDNQEEVKKCIQCLISAKGKKGLDKLLLILLKLGESCGAFSKKHLTGDKRQDTIEQLAPACEEIMNLTSSSPSKATAKIYPHINDILSYSKAILWAISRYSCACIGSPEVSIEDTPDIIDSLSSKQIILSGDDFDSVLVAFKNLKQDSFDRNYSSKTQNRDEYIDILRKMCSIILGKDTQEVHKDTYMTIPTSTASKSPSKGLNKLVFG